MKMSNYPDGAENDPRAPYNEVPTPEDKFIMSVSMSLSKEVEVITDDYKAFTDGEISTEDTDWRTVAISNGIENPAELVEKLRVFCKDYIALLELGKDNYKPVYTLEEVKSTIEQCEGWSVDEIKYFES